MTLILLGVAGLCPIVGIFCAIAHFSKSRNVSAAALIFGVSFAALLYGYAADIDNDIYRHILNLNLYRNIPLWKAFDAGRLTTVYTWDIWSWVLARTTNAFLLQASGALVGYTLIASCVLHYANRKNLDIKQYSLMLLLCISIVSPLDIAIGIRNANAFIICFYALYSFYVKKTGYIRCVIAFAIAIFLHHAAVLLLIVWLIMPLYKKNRIVVGVTTVVVLFTFTNYGDYMSRFMGGKSIVADLLADTMYSAFSYQSIVATSFHSLFTRYFQMLFTAALLIRGYTRKDFEEGDGREQEVDSLWDIAVLVFIIGVCLVFLLGSNGNRYFIFASLVAFIPFMNKIEDGYLRLNKMFLLDFLILGCSLGHIALYLYNMAWGTGDIKSLLLSSLIGFLSRL